MSGGSYNWRYSRKTPGRYNAMGGFKVWREPLPDKVIKGHLIKDTQRSWIVKFEGQSVALATSKRYCQRKDDTWTIPGWLWERMNGGDDLK